ncbi:urease accessory protein UreE [Radicibacter daui]|uniref:urease accessory protein UreE n=1 Tax=Radicibacter daui TaxID=3064829 RepID=UPI004046F5DB
MYRAIEAVAAGDWPAAEAIGSVTLTYEDRFRRRMRLPLDEGGDFLLDLPRVIALNEGDGLKLEAGGWVRVVAAPEPLVEVTAPEIGTLIRIAWHVGNRHFPAQLLPDRLFIRDDHVIVAMLEGLGATVRRVTAPFVPEGGAYGGLGHMLAHDHAPAPGTAAHAHAHSHDHHHDHGYHHHDGHDHSHEHDHGHDHHHHDHDHDHDQDHGQHHHHGHGHRHEH